jgi:organic hydroperoxide reductase OsmC/OhrA
VLLEAALRKLDVGDEMKISARVDNSFRKHVVTLTTNDLARELSIPPRADGVGSSANGGELLCLALATCYCNDLYREAKKRGIEVQRVEVEVEGTFGAEGAAAERLAYHARVSAKAPRQEIIELMKHTDSVAEIQNTLRRSCPILLTDVGAHEAV